MKETSTNKPPIWFWIISVIALIWNALGVMNYLSQAYMTEEQFATFPEKQQALFSNIPPWVTAAFALAVFGGLVGSILLLLRKRYAKPLFFMSLLAVLVNTIYWFFMTNFVEVLGVLYSIVPILTIGIAIFLVWFSKYAIKKQWIS